MLSTLLEPSLRWWAMWLWRFPFKIIFPNFNWRKYFYKSIGELRSRCFWNANINSTISSKSLDCGRDLPRNQSNNSWSWQFSKSRYSDCCSADSSRYRNLTKGPSTRSSSSIPLRLCQSTRWYSCGLTGSTVTAVQPAGKKFLSSLAYTFQNLKHSIRFTSCILHPARHTYPAKRWQFTITTTNGRKWYHRTRHYLSNSDLSEAANPLQLERYAAHFRFVTRNLSIFASRTSHFSVKWIKTFCLKVSNFNSRLMK